MMSDEKLTQWLLETKIPSIRYLTMSQVLNLPTIDPDLTAARNAIENEGPVPTILAKQSRIGAWAGEHSYYTPKYTSTHWSLLLLSELAADGLSSGMRRGSIYMLGETWDELQTHLDRESVGLTCFWANLARYALYCELDDDPRLRSILEVLIHDGTKGEWRCQYNDDRPCAWGAARTLWAFSALPKHLREKKSTQKAIQNGISFLLEEYNLVEADYPLSEGGKVHTLWSKLSFPLFYQADILFVLRVLAELNLLDHPGAADALQWLQDRAAANGRWRGGNPFRSRTWDVGDRNDINRWITLHATNVLNQAS